MISLWPSFFHKCLSCTGDLCLKPAVVSLSIPVKKRKWKGRNILGWGLSKSISRWEDLKQTDSFSFRYSFIECMTHLNTPTDLVPLIYVFNINLTHILMTQWWLCYPGDVPAVISFKNYPDRCWRQLHLTDITYLWDPLNPNASDNCREQILNFD